MKRSDFLKRITAAIGFATIAPSILATTKKEENIEIESTLKGSDVTMPSRRYDKDGFPNPRGKYRLVVKCNDTPVGRAWYRAYELA